MTGFGVALGANRPYQPRNLDAGQSRLVHSRNIGCGCGSRVSGDRIGFDCAGAHLRQRGGRPDDHHIDLTGYKVLHGWSSAAIRHEQVTRASLPLEEGTRDVHSGRRNRLGCFVWVRFQPGDKPLKVVGRHGFSGDDDPRGRRNQTDRRKILHEVIGKLRG